MVDRTPPGFLFCVKANEATTHKLDRSVLDEYKAGIAPICDAGRLGSVLAQFPYSFRNTNANRQYLHQLAKDFADYRPVVEFRHLSWIKLHTQLNVNSVILLVHSPCKRTLADNFTVIALSAELSDLVLYPDYRFQNILFAH